MTNKRTFSERYGSLYATKAKCLHPGISDAPRWQESRLCLYAVMTRVVRGFYNVCRHRAAQVVRKEHGTARSFTCIYHHWNYGLDGRLRAISKPAGYEAVKLDASCLGLVSVRVELLAGLLFVCLDPHAESLKEYLGETCAAFLEPLGTVPLEVFHFHKAFVKTNWKLWQDNNTERYHGLLHAANRKTQAWVQGKRAQ